MDRDYFVRKTTEMPKPPRPAPFVLISSNHGTMIVNRNDYHIVDDRSGYGVGFDIMSASEFSPSEVGLILKLLQLRRAYFGEPVVAVDCGANIGVHTVEWARAMYGWGHVYAFEAQEKIYYALAGNIIINNCLNVTARCAAVGNSSGVIDIPEPNYLMPASFGSFELKQSENTEFIGQPVDYSHPTQQVPCITLDSLSLERMDLIKIDVEGMEIEVLEGAAHSIERHRPALFIEVIKSDQERLNGFLAERGYRLFPAGMNVVALHEADASLEHVKLQDGRVMLIPHSGIEF